MIKSAYIGSSRSVLAHLRLSAHICLPGHRPPGAYNYIGDMQDFRMYPTALNAVEVKKIAYDTTGPAKRECSLNDEDGDSNYRDINGNTCEWYYEALNVKGRTKICSSPDVRANCPVACKVKDACYEPQAVALTKYTIWNRIMLLEKKAIAGIQDTSGKGLNLVFNNGVLCARQGIDVVKECRTLEAHRDPRSYPIGALARNSWHNWLHLPQPNITDCDLVARMLEPFCSFPTPDNWHLGFDKLVRASNVAFTLSFWMRYSEADVLSRSNIMFLSSVAPPKPRIIFDFSGGTMGPEVWLYPYVCICRHA